MFKHIKEMVERSRMEITGEPSSKLDDSCDVAFLLQLSQCRKSRNRVLFVKTEEKQKQQKRRQRKELNFPVDEFSSLGLPSPLATLPSPSATLPSNYFPLEFSIYLRIYHTILHKSRWYRFKHGSSGNCLDEMPKGIITRTLEQEDTSWNNNIRRIDTCIYKFDGTRIRVLDTKAGSGGGFGSMLEWKNAPSVNMLPSLYKVVCLNKSLYATRDLRGPPFNREIPCNLWIAVLRPQSTEWELLLSPSPKFPGGSMVFFHAVEELDKLLVGSFEDNVLYLYDPKAMALPEKVEYFSPYPKFADTVVIGRYLVWLYYDELYVYNLVSKESRHERIIGIDDFVRLTNVSYVSAKFLYFGYGRFCLVFLDECRTTSILRFFEFSVRGRFLESPYATSSYLHEIRHSQTIVGAFVMAEGESDAAGNGLRRIEESCEVGATLAKYPYVAYVPDGNDMLFALGAGI